MAIVNGYCTLTDVKAVDRLKISDPDSDGILEQVIEAASRVIDRDRGRHFYSLAATRYFTAEFSDLLIVPDLLSVTSLATDGGLRDYATAWSATDYDLEPYNAAGAGEPYTRLTTAPNGVRSFPLLRRGVKIVGAWGYAAAAPPAIREACVLLTIRVYKRAKAPFGVAGFDGLGQIVLNRMQDPDIRLLLDSIPLRPGVYGV
jgi:hypothetical protein